MSFEEPNLDHLARNGEKVYGKKPSEEYIRQILKENKKAEEELARKLANRKPGEPIKLFELDDLDLSQKDEPEIEEESKKAA